MLMFVCLCFIFGSTVESTDLAFTYKHQILIIKNVDKPVAPTESHEVKYFNKDGGKGYPVGLAYNSKDNTLLVADLEDERADIRSVQLGSNTPVQAETVVAKYGTSSIETVLYDSRQSLVIWNDPFKNAIYSASKSQKFVPKVMENVDTSKPRGLAFDTCGSTLYWSDRSVKEPGVFMHELVNGDKEVISGKLQGKYYQGMAFDPKTKELWWTETTTDFANNSTCTFSVYQEGSRSVFGSIPECYPFSLVLDEKFIYWSDWARGAIMRLSRTNPRELAIIFKTPAFSADKKEYNGAYGLVNLNETVPNCGKKFVSFIPEETAKETPEIENILPKETEESSTFSIPVSQDFEGSENFSLYNFLPFFNLGLTTVCLIITFVVWICLMKLRASNQKLRSSLASYKKNFGPCLPANLPKSSNKPKRFAPAFMRPAPPCDDGVHIDIENCCQMTLCERPCFSTITKEGKSYIGPYSKKSEDKLKLLDDAALA